MQISSFLPPQVFSFILSEIFPAYIPFFLLHAPLFYFRLFSFFLLTLRKLYAIL
nr:MAG TPA: hypothetical protein [Caudoviricetes sp.]